MNHSLDCTLGLLICYGLFKIVDIAAISGGIEVLKSGVYLDESIKLVVHD
jgi:hypothetical protein